MTTDNIEEISAKISAKTMSRFLWYFSVLLLGMAALYYGIQIKLEQIESDRAVQTATFTGQINLINANMENIKSNVSDVKDDVKDIKQKQAQKK